MSNSPFFNAHHSPIGAFATLTFGCKGPQGGLGLELGGPANEHLFIGAESAQTPGDYDALPFFGELRNVEADFDIEHMETEARASRVRPYKDDQIHRNFRAATDTWTAGDLTFRVLSPILPVPDPESGQEEALKTALCPAVLVELTLDNRKGQLDRKVFFGYQGSDRACGMRTLDVTDIVGVGQGLKTAIATTDDMQPGIAWTPDAALEPGHPANRAFMLGSIGLLIGHVPAGETRTYRIAVAFHLSGTVTAGLPTRYLYNRWFNSIEDVARHALANFDHYTEKAKEADQTLEKGLSETQRLAVAHAVRSYYGSTQLLERQDGRPLWIVNEGEYRMMNTADLMADQAFYELRMHPWTLRNELDFFAERYSYVDQCGLAFCHDVGVANSFSRPGNSSYEKAGITGCFSYMSTEELTNWVLCACLYIAKTGDITWRDANLDRLKACFASLLARDHEDPTLRDGVMDIDTDRCDGGAEITTYDSLDVSLGQARRNVYLAVKWWAAFVMLQDLWATTNEPDLAATAQIQVNLAEKTITESANEEGLLPAVLGSTTPARIIPVIEGLIFLMETDLLTDAHADFVATLERHLRAVLKVGVCKFPDGAWKLSSTSDNSWLSKIYLCQHIAKTLFQIEDPQADDAHWAWLMDPENIYFAWSDQMLAGKAVGSRYYPRGVTSVLWTNFRA